MTARITFAAPHDLVTKLPNRVLLNDRLTQFISLAPTRTSRSRYQLLDFDGVTHPTIVGHFCAILF
jgi:GGDEF domain-containing protein